MEVCIETKLERGTPVKLSPLNEYDKILIMLSSAKDSVTCTMELLDMGVPPEKSSRSPHLELSTIRPRSMLALTHIAHFTPGAQLLTGMQPGYGTCTKNIGSFREQSSDQTGDPLKIEAYSSEGDLIWKKGIYDGRFYRGTVQK